MQIYFSEVPAEYNDEETFEFEGRNYYYSIDLEDDQVIIKDTVGRYVPFSIEDIRGLFNALIVADTFTAPIARGLEALERINQDTVHTV